MITRLLFLIPLLARRRRRARMERGARVGIPTLIGIAAAAAFLIRRRRRSSAGFDAAPSELAGQPAGMSEAATATRAASDSAVAATGRATTMDADPDDVAAGAVHGDVQAPDTAADDPLVVEAENAAAADAAAIGNDVPDGPR